MTHNSCPCGTKLRMRAEHVGKKVKCPKCGLLYSVFIPPGATEPELLLVAKLARSEAVEPPTSPRAADDLLGANPLLDFPLAGAPQPAPTAHWLQPPPQHTQSLVRPRLFIGIAAATIALCVLAFGTVWIVKKLGDALAARAERSERLLGSVAPLAAAELPDSNEKMSELYPKSQGTDSTQLWIDAGAALDNDQFDAMLNRGAMGIDNSLKFSLPVDSEIHIGPAAHMVGKYRDALAWAHSAASEGGHAHYPTDFSKGLEAPFTEGLRLRRLSKLLLIEACYNAAVGKMDRCTDALVTAISCSQSLLGYPTTLADLRRTTDLMAACNCATQLVERYQFNSHQLTRLRNALRAARGPDQSARCLTGDFGLTLISMKAKRLDILVDEAQFPPEKVASALKTYNNPTKLDYDYFFVKAREVLDACEAAFPERLDKFDAIGDEIDETLAMPPAEQPHAGVLVTLSVLPYAKALAQFYAIADLSQVIVACDHYRHEKGRLPARLDELVPQFLDRVPLDPFDGQPLRFISDPDGVTVYSVSHNRKDDAGLDDDKLTDIVRELSNEPKSQSRFPADVAESSPSSGRTGTGTAIALSPSPSESPAVSLAPAAPSGSAVSPDSKAHENWPARWRENGRMHDVLSDVRLTGRSLLKRGSWNVSDTPRSSPVLESSASGNASYLQLARDLPTNYRLKIDVEIVAGEGSFNVALPMPDSTVLLVLDGWGKRVSGLNMVNGRTGDQNETTYTSPVLKHGQTNHIEVSVIEDGIHATVNGQQVINWRGHSRALSIDKRFWPPDHKKLWIGSWQTHYRVSRFEWVELEMQ